jgi:hypothetical protein
LYGNRAPRATTDGLNVSQSSPFRYNSLLDRLLQGTSLHMPTSTTKTTCPRGRNTGPEKTPFIALGLLFCLLLFPLSGLAQSSDGEASAEESSGWKVEQWYFFTSVYTKHWDDDPDHVNNQKMLGGEAQMKNNWLFGLAMFDNSFGQFSQYLYAGYKWDLFGSELFYFKLTGGLLHGYKEPYEDKIPLNDLGVAPAILPTFGFQYKFFVTELNIAGTAAVTITAGIAF